MHLKILAANELMIADPTEAEIKAALDDTFEGKNDGLILVDDDANNIFMQVAAVANVRKGALVCQVEYCVGRKGPIYAADGIPHPVVAWLFLSYLRGDGAWRQAMPWRVEIESL
ncbi:hypothetical protein BH23GEM2_BH23GEM2_14830 [soil metagenome]